MSRCHESAEHQLAHHGAKMQKPVAANLRNLCVGHKGTPSDSSERSTPQLQCNEDEKEATPIGKLCYVRAPMGSKQSPASGQKVMRDMMQDTADCHLYEDDLVSCDNSCKAHHHVKELVKVTSPKSCKTKN